MNYKEYRATAMEVAYLASCAVNAVALDAARVAAMDLSAVYQVSKCHMLEGIAAMVLLDAGVTDKDLSSALGNAIRKTAILDMERAVVLQKLDEAGVWYVPLKGAVIKTLYPSLGMRQMSDNDILFDAARADDVRAIMEGLGFTVTSFGQTVHDKYSKPPVCNFELHRALFETGHNARLAEYYRDVRARLLPDGESRFGLRFSDEDEYVYLTAHEYKHYFNHGTGLRSLLDVYVFCLRKGAELDWAYIGGELDKLGLTDFEAQSRGLALRLFGGEPLTEADNAMLEYVLSSGAFGNKSNWINNQLALKGRRRYVLSRAFIPRKELRKTYPILDRFPILLPLGEVQRWADALYKKPNQLLSEFKAVLKK